MVMKLVEVRLQITYLKIKKVTNLYLQVFVVLHGKPWIDRDNDFLIGESGGVLMKIDFVFVGTEIFSRVADFYEKHGCYCLEPDDSPNAIKILAM